MIINRDNLPRLNFTYLRMDQFPLLEGILSSNMENLKMLNDKYSLISHTDYPLFHDCIIYNFIYDDLMKYKEFGYLRMFYNEFVEKFGQEKVDLFVVKDRKEIENKIYDAIVFAFDKIYKSDIIEITFNKDARISPSALHSITNIIHEIIFNHFTIIEQRYDEVSKNVRIIISSTAPILDPSSNNDV